MYCNVRTDQYGSGIAATVLFFVFAAIAAALFFYYKAYRRLVGLETNVQPMLADDSHKKVRTLTADQRVDR
jgi:hypothetical protein